MSLMGCFSLRESTESFDYMSQLEVTGDNGVWFKGFYVDEFGDFDGKSFIKTITDGLFKNSVTMGSLLKVEILVNPNTVELGLYEYGKYPISYYDEAIKIKIKYNGQTVDLGYGSFDENTKRIKT